MGNYAAEQIRLTSALIDSSPVELTLLRRPLASARTPAGGVARVEDSWEPQEPIRVFFGAKQQDDMPLQDSQGERTIAYYTIVALPDTDIVENDEFDYNGDRYRVTRVATHLDYEVKADVETYYGGRR